MNLNTAARNTAHVTIRQQDISLLCPHCDQFMLQLSPSMRPIQEKKHACPACSKQTRMAKLKTRSGDTYQLYLRQIDPKARVSVYSYKK
jgi:transposase-like protein